MVSAFNFLIFFVKSSWWPMFSTACSSAVLALTLGEREDAQEPITAGSQGDLPMILDICISHKPFTKMGGHPSPGPLGSWSSEEKHSD